MPTYRFSYELPERLTRVTDEGATRRPEDVVADDVRVVLGYLHDDKITLIKVIRALVTDYTGTSPGLKASLECANEVTAALDSLIEATGGKSIAAVVRLVDGLAPAQQLAAVRRLDHAFVGPQEVA